MKYHAYPEYKKSQVKWLVEFPENWEEKRLRFEIISNPVKSEINSLLPTDLVSFVPMDAIGEKGGLRLDTKKMLADVYNGYTYFINGDLVVAKITPCFENGKGAIAKGLTNAVGFGTTELHVLRPLKGLNNRYLFYLTMSHPFRRIGASEMLGAGGQKRVPEDYIKNFRIGIPDPDEQENIANFLDHTTTQVDQLIEKKRALIEKLNEQRIAIITHAVTKGLDETVPMKDSGVEWLGEVPVKWDIIRVRYCTEFVTSGSRGWAKFFSDEGSLFLRITNLTRDSVKLDLDDIQRVLPPDGSEGERTSTNTGDILVSITADLGSVAVIPDTLGAAYISQHIALVRPELSRVHSKWLALSIFSHSGKAQLLCAGYGGTKVQLNLNDVKEVAIALPPSLNEQNAIVETLEVEIKKVDSLISSVENAITKLEEYRSALITAAVTGKIDVRGIKFDKDAA